MSQISEEERQRISKTKDTIELIFGKTNADAKQCILFQRDDNNNR